VATNRIPTPQDAPDGGWTNTAAFDISCTDTRSLRSRRVVLTVPLPPGVRGR
jgi:hypothetical protein